jgi:hypothetical protein
MSIPLGKLVKIPSGVMEFAFVGSAVSHWCRVVARHCCCKWASRWVTAAKASGLVSDQAQAPTWWSVVRRASIKLCHASIKLYDGKRLVRQRVLMYVLD